MDISFSTQIPKICIPVVSQTDDEIYSELQLLNSMDFDLIEFRADFYKNLENLSDLKNLLIEMRTIFNKPILFTIRTKNEGGNIDLSWEQYKNLLTCAIESNCIDLVDIQFYIPENTLSDIVSLAKQKNIKIILSNHDFTKTPSQNEIIHRLTKMYLYGADISKIAVMPNCEEDILSILQASLYMKKQDKPFIAISMGKIGCITRICGELFGSCMTFASSKKSSAPGQINVDDMKKIIDILHI